MRLRFCLLPWALLLPLYAAAEPPLRLVADPWPPFNDATLLNNGLASDLVATALSRAGYSTRYVQVPWERALQGVEKGTYDVLISAWFNKERAAFGYYSRPYLTNRIRFLRRKGSQIEFQQLSDLYPPSIAVVRGYAYSREFDLDSRLNKIGVVGFEVGARMLLAQRVQLTLEDELVARYHLGRSLAEVGHRLEFLAQPLSERGLHILVSRRHPEHQQIAEAFNQSIEAMRVDGSYAEIFRRHGL